MRYKYLNDLTFTWKLSYSDPAVGYWSFDAINHPHPQWVTITVQSNPQWFGAWGIQQLLNQWKIKTADLFSAPSNVFSGLDDTKGLRLYQEAVDAEGIRDPEAVRCRLDRIVFHTRTDLYNHIFACSQAEGEHAAKAVYEADSFVGQFDAAFS